MLARWLCVALLTACGPSVPTGPARPYVPGALPAFPVLGSSVPAGHTAYDNRSLANLLVELTHGLEWGASRPNLVRYESPVSVGVAGEGAKPFLGFLDRFLSQLRSNTGISISRGPEPHNLMIRFVDGQDYRRRVPQHFCVVAPGHIDWETFRDNPIRLGARAFETQNSVQDMTIFIPDNAAPYIVRTCLIEEIVQALGPANDLYGLGPSIFNDDAAHIWPTRLDYLMLRVLYSSEIHTGMTRRQTREAGFAALTRLNPQGIGAPPLPPLRDVQMAGWTRSIQAAFDRRTPRETRIREASKALAIAERRAPDSAYHCRAVDVLARVARRDGQATLNRVRNGDQICARAHGPDDIRVARIRLSVAHLHYATNNPAAAVALTEDIERPLAGHGQDERLTAFYALRGAALTAIQQSSRGEEARRLAGEWGAYALGSDHPNVRRWRQH